MGNAYDNASLIVTPNAYKASKIYALKPDDGSGDLSFSRAGSKMVRNSSGLWETIGTNIPPLHYPVGGGCPSWLFEAEATCLIPNSNVFTGGCTKTTGITDSPISGLTSVRITKTSASYEYVVSSYSATIANATPYAISLFFKYDGHDIDSSIEFNNGGDFGISFKANIEIRSSGITISSVTSCTAVLVAEINGWYRLEVSLTSTTVTTNSGSILILASGANGATFLVTTSNITQEVNPSSPIITAGSTVTRVADVVSKTGASEIIGQTEGTIFVDVVINSENNPSANVINGAKNTSSSFAIIRVKATKAIRAFIYNSTVLKADITGGSYNLGDRLKIAYAYKSGDSALYVNGTQLGTSADAISFPATLSELNWDDATTYFGYQEAENINETRISKTRLPNAELAALTTI